MDMSIEVTKSLDTFETDLAGINMRGQWQFDRMLEQVIGGPRPAGVPYLWSWDQIRTKLEEACDVLPESFTARRNISFMNPGIERGTTHTLTMGMQMLKPGEIAWAHRHTLAALRFAIKGNPGMVTVVDGEPCPMEDYDLVLTPRWTWHDHHNGTDEPIVWLDVLDLGIVLGLNAPFYEPFGEQRQPERERPGDFLQTRAGTVRPVWERRKQAHVPYRYPWKMVEPILLEMAAASDGSPYDGVALEYVNPMTGGPTMPTIGCWVQLLKPGMETLPHKHTASGCFFVVRGEGTTVVDGQELHWSQHDSFCIPNWVDHHFINRSRSEDAILFSVNDIPTLQALGLYYERPEQSLASQDWPAVPGDIHKGLAGR
jgi:1-hydroxy-2-naphthoate dioxygenase